MRLIFLLASICAIITGGFSTIDNDVFALSCAQINMTKSVEDTGILFSGLVISTQNPKTLGNMSYEVINIFSITEKFKGIDEEMVEVYSDETWGPYFQEGLEYLVFADRFDNKIQAQLCSPTNLVEKSDIKLVKKLTENNSLPQLQKIDLKIIPDKVKYGESVFYYYSLPSYEKPDEERYYHKVINPEGIQIDSTLWYAKQDSEYEFRTNHPAYNITKAGQFTIIFEKAIFMEPTGQIVKTDFFEITTNPPPMTQYESGINLDSILCNNKLQLIFKSMDNSPACVKSESIQKLIERGWAKS